MNNDFEDLEEFLKFDPTAPNDPPETPPSDPPTGDDDPDEGNDPEPPTPQDPPKNEPPKADPPPKDEPPKADEDPYFKMLLESGVIEVDDDFNYDGTDESIAKALEITEARRWDKAKNSVIEALPPQFKAVIDYALAGGESLEDYVATFAAPQLDHLDLSEEQNQEYVVYQYWKETSNYTDQKIRKMIDRLRESGSLEESAKEAVDELKEERAIKQAAFVEEQRKQQAEQIKKQQETAEAFRKALESYKTTPTRKEKITKLYHAAPGEQSEFHKRLKAITANQEHLIQFSDLIVDYDEKQGFNFEKFKEQSKSEGVRGLRTVLEQRMSGAKNKTTGSPVQVKSDDLDLEKFLGYK